MAAHSCKLIQVRSKYRNKKMVTSRHGPIVCNETLDWAASTADTFKCSDTHMSAESCNFKCLPQTCVAQQMLSKAYSYEGWLE